MYHYDGDREVKGKERMFWGLSLILVPFTFSRRDTKWTKGLAAGEKERKKEYRLIHYKYIYYKDNSFLSLISSPNAGWLLISVSFVLSASQAGEEKERKLHPHNVGHTHKLISTAYSCVAHIVDACGQRSSFPSLFLVPCPLAQNCGPRNRKE